MPANYSSQHRPLPTTCLRGVLAGLALIASCGCQPDASPSSEESHQTPAQEPINHSDALMNKPAEKRRREAITETASRFPWESWYAYYIDGEHVGFNHLAADLVSIQDRPHVRYRMEDRLTIRRGTAKLMQHIQQECLEQQSGQPVRLEATVRIGSDTTLFRGRMEGDVFRLETTRGEATTAREIPWQGNFFGPHAVEQSLRDNPLARDGQRIVRTLIPIQAMVGRNELNGMNHEATDLRDGHSQRLLKIENRLWFGENQGVTSYAWTDALGRIIKLAVPSLKLTGYRTNRAAATAAVDPQRDVLASTFIRLSRPVDQPRTLKEAVYRVTLTEDAHLQTLDFPELPGQKVARQRAGSLQLTVRSGLHHLPSPAWSRPHAADLASGPLIDYQAASVQALKKQAVREQPPDEKATALQLTRFVHEHVAQKDFSRSFARASQVAEEAVGDCTEHAVLLAALLRDQQIPARIAAGLVYLDTAGGPAMGYHMWNLAFVDGGWIALDATLGTGLAPADRITILTCDLASGNEYECLIPVLSVLGQLQIEVVAADGQITAGQ